MPSGINKTNEFPTNTEALKTRESRLSLQTAQSIDSFLRLAAQPVSTKRQLIEMVESTKLLPSIKAICPADKSIGLLFSQEGWLHFVQLTEVNITIIRADAASGWSPYGFVLAENKSRTIEIDLPHYSYGRYRSVNGQCHLIDQEDAFYTASPNDVEAFVNDLAGELSQWRAA